MCNARTLRRRPRNALLGLTAGLLSAASIAGAAPAAPRQLSPVVATALSPLVARPPSPAALQQSAPDPAASQAENPPGGIIDQILVRVNGAAILHSDFESQWQERLAVIASQVPQDQIDAQKHQLRLTVLQAMVEELMLDQRAVELGFTADPNDIDRALMAIREENGYLDDDLWRQALAQNGLTETSMRETIRRSIVQQRMIFQEIQRQIFVNDREVQSYYDENIEEFSEPEQVLFQQLVFVYAGTDRQPIRERAEAALAELRGGASLSAVGAKYSAESVQSADQASWIPSDDLQPEIHAAMQNLSPLAYSDVVEGRFGYYILQLMDRRDAQIRPLAGEVAREVRALLENQKTGEKFQEYTTELRTKVHLEIFSDEFADLESAWDRGNEGAPTGTPGQRR